MYLLSLFLAFKSLNYRWYTVGQVFSNIGIMIETIALSWLVYQLTDSALYVGILFFAGQATIFLSSPFSGYLSDCFSRKHILLWVNMTYVVISLSLGTLILTEMASFPILILVQLLIGLLRGIDAPTRSVFINDVIVDPKHLVNAISLNTSLINVAKIIGPTLAALLIPWIGEWFCFYVSACCALIFVLVVSTRIFPAKRTRLPGRINFIAEMKEGLRYAYDYLPVRAVILFIACIGLFTVSMYVILPVYVSEILHGDADTYGFITTYSGVGALLGALYMASRKSALGFDFLMLLASVLYGIGFIWLAGTSVFVYASLYMVLIGFAQVLMFASASSILQTLSHTPMLGRIMGLYFMFFMAFTMMGSLLAGKLSDFIGPAMTMQYLSFVTLLMACVYGFYLKKIRRKSLRSFIRIGVNPDRLRRSPVALLWEKTKSMMAQVVFHIDF
jgi:MFS family permease